LRGFLATTGLVVAVSVIAGAPVPAADVEAGRKKAETCAACHGADGNATIPGMPSLAGQPTLYTHWQLIKFRDGRRGDAQMTPFTANLSDTDMADLAAFYAAQRPQSRPAATDPAKVAEGERLAQVHHCTSCHRPDLSGHEQVPRLAGQDLAYVRKQLAGFKARTASDLDGTMTMSAQPLEDADVESLAQYLNKHGGGH
jgi:cytochrome c553